MLHHNDITMFEEFAGLGGTAYGASCVPWINVTDAANHKEAAVRAHSANFPNARHYHADITKLDIADMPYATIFGGSPVCPPFSNAAGVTRDFDKKNAQLALFDRTDDSPRAIKLREKYARGRLLMHEPLRYLRAMLERHGKPVLGGVIENVPQARQWAEWDAYIAEYHKLGYLTKLIAYNSMHAAGTRSPLIPQSRNRLYLMFWHKSLGRNPDFDKWLRPQAYCSDCDRVVNALQVFKRPGADMGMYRSQWTWRCPATRCRAEVFPSTVPAANAIDASVPGIRLGDRAKLGMDPLVENTMDRIRAGYRKYWLPMIAGARQGGEGPAFELMPFITPHRGGGDLGKARSIMDPVHTVTAAGNHHGLVLPPLVIRNYTQRPGAAASLVTPASEPVRSLTTSGNQSVIWPPKLLVPYYSGSKTALPADRPVGTITTRDSYGVIDTDLDALFGELDLDDVRFRMLTADEIGRCMGFPDDYDVATDSHTVAVDLYGNACTPAVMELLYSALAECIAGQSLPRNAYALAG